MFKTNMTPDQKEAWTTALRSGNFSQVRGALEKRNQGFCCLGVFAKVCDLGRTYIPGSTDAEWKAADREIQDTYDRIRKILPQIDDRNVADRLMAMNDIEGKTFAEIADWVATNLEPVPA
jgi:hypothetical protein